MSGEGTSREGRTRARRRWRFGPRAIVEAAVIVGAVVGFGVVRERNTFPKPLIRALRGGAIADREEAVRTLSVAGIAGAEAVPALLEALGGDPSPSVRRGSAFVLAAVASAPAGGEPFSLDLLLAGTEDPGLDRSADGRPIRPPHPAAVPAAAGLGRAVADDPDPTVRAQAITALGDLLDAGLGLRPLEPPPEGVAFPDPSAILDLKPAFGVEPWMRAAAGSIADQAGSADAAVSRLAILWAYAAPAARVLLDDDRRSETLLAGAEAALRAPSDFMDVLLIRAAAVAGRGSADRRARFLRLLDGPLARTAPEPAPLDPSALFASPFFTNSLKSRPLHPDEHAIPFLVAGATADDLEAHPGALEALVRLLGRDGRLSMTFTSGYSRDPEPPLETLAGVRLRDEERRAGLQNMTLAPLVLKAIRDDPRILDLLGDRLGPGHWAPLLDDRGQDAWEPLGLMPWLLAPDRRTALPPDRADRVSAVLAEVFDGLPVDDSERRGRALALMAPFVRGAGPGSPAASRFAQRAEALAGDPQPDASTLGRLLLDAVAPPGS